MGIEEIQKINALARELMRHGIATTSDEAVLRAEEMLRGNGVDSMSAAITSSSSTGASAPYHASQEMLSSLNMDVRSLGVRLEAVAREVLGLKDEIKKLGGGLNDMGRQVSRMSVQQPVQSHAEHRAEEVSAPQAVQAAPAQQSFAREAVQPAQAFEKPRMMNVRTGKEEFRSEDVAIEKIFYFGK